MTAALRSYLEGRRVLWMRRGISAAQGGCHAFGFHTLVGAAVAPAPGAASRPVTPARSRRSTPFRCGAQQQEACRRLSADVWKRAARGSSTRAKRPGGVGPRAPTGPRAFLAASRLRTRTRESDSRLAIYESLQGERAGERTKWSSRRREVLPDSSRVGPLPHKGHAEPLAELGQVAADGQERGQSHRLLLSRPGRREHRR